MSWDCQTTRIELLPTEVLRIAIGLLHPWEIKRLSCVNKRLREVCLPSLFRQVEFQFSPAGFDGLKSLLKSDARFHVVSFSYVVSELLKPEILDFDRFKSDLLTPDNYVEQAKIMYDDGDPPDQSPPYMVIYDTLHSICREQRSIVDGGVDLSVLSFALGALPQLTDVSLCFDQVIKIGNWLWPYLTRDMTLAQKSHEYHIRVVSHAIRSAKSRGVSIRAINLMEFDLPYYDSWEVPDLGSLSEALRELLGFAQVLHLRGSDTPLELLSHCALNLHHLDMCGLMVRQTAITGFLETNKKSIHSVGFHDVRLTAPGQQGGGFPTLSPGLLCSILNAPQSLPCQPTDCRCPPRRGKGWRLLLNDDRSQCPTVESAKGS